ncbi:MAG: LysR family transcriptional regulator [Burkholderiaceae bacterium]
MNKSDNREPQVADLKTVLALLQDGTVTRAAQRLGLTQSALSYQLERMRRRFADPLFVRVGNRMAPTPFAQRLAEPAARVMRIIEAEIATLSSFDPASTQREFRIGMNEIGAITLLPRLVRRMAELAPHARLTPMHVEPASLAAALESGEMDLAAGHFAQPRSDLLQQLLYRRDYVCIVRRDHPQIGRSMSLRQFSRTPQVQAITTPSMQAWLQAQLRSRKLSATVRISTQHIAAIPFVVAASDHAALIPREIHDLFAPITAIRIVKLPVAIPEVAVHQYWHPRVAGDPAVKFLRTAVLAAARKR